MISSLWLWVILVVFCGSCVVVWFASRAVDRKMLAKMRKEGLTDEDIEHIIGSSGYRRLNKH